MTLEMAMLEIDARRSVADRGEAHLGFARLREIRLIFPVRRDLPSQIRTGVKFYTAEKQRLRATGMVGRDPDGRAGAHADNDADRLRSRRCRRQDRRPADAFLLRPAPRAR